MPRKKQAEKLVTSLNRDDLLELLKAFNELKGIRERASEMHDLYLSDVDKLYSIERTISEKFRFKPQMCKEQALTRLATWSTPSPASARER